MCVFYRYNCVDRRWKGWKRKDGGHAIFQVGNVQDRISMDFHKCEDCGAKQKSKCPHWYQLGYNNPLKIINLVNYGSRFIMLIQIKHTQLNVFSKQAGYVRNTGIEPECFFQATFEIFQLAQIVMAAVAIADIENLVQFGTHLLLKMSIINTVCV